MADQSKIEWTDATWPIVQGCDPISQGCANCYAVPLLWRMAHNPDPKISSPLQGVTELHVNAAGERILRFTGKIALREDRLDWPLKWKQPRMIFVPSHGDLFHKDVPDSFIDKVFAVGSQCPQHTLQILTKRSDRMRDYVASVADESEQATARRFGIALSSMKLCAPLHGIEWPLPNIWLGVSCECQQEADERIPHLLQTPAAVRFVSAEPLLGPIDLNATPLTNPTALFPNGEPALCQLDWVIVGGESGSKARPMHPDWARLIRDQCKAAGVAFFFKQWGRWKDGSDFAPNAEIVLSGGRRFDTKRSMHELDREVDGVMRFNPTMMAPVGKKAAGRLLDGIEHNEFPKEESASVIEGSVPQHRTSSPDPNQKEATS